MTPIPAKLRKEIAADPFYEHCIRLHEGECSGHITWEHAWIYAGKQIQEKWAIVPLCYFHHLGGGLEKEKGQAVALLRATTDDLAKYPKTPWYQHKRYLFMKHAEYLKNLDL